MKEATKSSPSSQGALSAKNESPPIIADVAKKNSSSNTGAGANVPLYAPVPRSAIASWLIDPNPVRAAAEHFRDAEDFVAASLLYEKYIEVRVVRCVVLCVLAPGVLWRCFQRSRLFQQQYQYGRIARQGPIQFAVPSTTQTYNLYYVYDIHIHMKILFSFAGW